MSDTNASNVKSHIQTLNKRTYMKKSVSTGEVPPLSPRSSQQEAPSHHVDTEHSDRTPHLDTFGTRSLPTTPLRSEPEIDVKKAKRRISKDSKFKRNPKITPLGEMEEEDEGYRPKATRQQSKNILDNAFQFMNMNTLHQLISAGNLVLQRSTATQEYFERARTMYQSQFKEDMRPFYGVMAILGLVFFFFILQPLLLVLRFGVFGFVCYSSYYTISESGFGKNETMQPFVKLGLLLLVAYLFKYLI